jgi:diguanylate cyclase (GGDEF)-like protein
VHVGALAVIPILFIAYYLRPYASLITAFLTGAVLGLFEHLPAAADHMLEMPPLFDALMLSIALCTVVVVANRLREASTTNELLRGSLVKARRMAERDPLTGIANRAYFTRMLHDAIARATPQRRLGVLFCDLDGFKSINDVHGHPTGDAVLRMAAARLLNTVRSLDVVARLGGDEFAILVQPLRDAAEARHMAVNIERAFADPFHAESNRHRIGITVGVSLCPDDACDSDALLRIADTRMYALKTAKKAARAVT